MPELRSLTREEFSRGRVKHYIGGAFLGQTRKFNDMFIVSLEQTRDAYGLRVKSTVGLSTEHVAGVLKDGSPYFDTEEAAVSFLIDNFSI